MANTAPSGSKLHIPTYQLSSPSCSTRAIWKSLTLNEECLWVFWREKKSGEWAISKMTRQTGQKTREEIGKGNQMTALWFQTGGDVRYPRLPFEGTETKIIHVLLFLHQRTLYMYVAQAHRNTSMMLFHVSASCASLQQSSKTHSVILSQCIYTPC